MPTLALPKTRVLAPEAFLRALLDERTRLAFPQAARSRAYPEWHVQRRAIPEHLLYLFTEHVCEGVVAGKPLRLEPGSFVWVMPGVLHEFRIPRGQPAFGMFHFKIAMQMPPKKDNAAPRLRSNFIYLPNAQELQSACAGLVREAHRNTPLARLHARAWLLLLMGEALRLADAAGPAAQTLSERQRQLLGAYVREHLAKRPRPSELAGVLRLSPDYFARIFRKTFGIPPRAWLVRERMTVAAQRLSESNLTVSEVAYELGFQDVFLFSRQFKRIFGRAPRAFRREPGGTFAP
ncbi:MAG: helix-turn-helix transcriptional regulator [Planctomycetes bacterium]|nr:helix-turn-helix transcriptional regulator [Planctomycetota bacterium]